MKWSKLGIEVGTEFVELGLSKCGKITRYVYV